MADETINKVVDKVVDTVKTNPAVAGLATAAMVGVAWTISDFREWKSYGTGGTPPTWAGYWRMTKFRVGALLRGDDQLDASVYSADGQRFLKSELPRRAAPRPRLMPRILPQRQMPPSSGQGQGGQYAQALVDLIPALAARRPEALEVKPSHTEGGTTDGLYARKGLATLGPTARDPILNGEIAHVHPNDGGSLHLCLADGDARDVIERGWGQRFSLNFVNRSWVMIYAPRTAEELKVIESIVNASITYVAGIEI